MIPNFRRPQKTPEENLASETRLKRMEEKKLVNYRIKRDKKNKVTRDSRRKNRRI